MSKSNDSLESRKASLLAQGAAYRGNAVHFKQAIESKLHHVPLLGLASGVTAGGGALTTAIGMIGPSRIKMLRRLYPMAKHAWSFIRRKRLAKPLGTAVLASSAAAGLFQLYRTKVSHPKGRFSPRQLEHGMRPMPARMR
ncbi:MAG: hypothetical protein ACTHKB_02215 [Burkholderiaceae bacterium]